MAKYKYLVVVSGEDEFRVREFMHTALNHLVPADLRDFNYDRVSGSDASAEQIATLAATPPMMSDRRVIHIDDAHKLDKASISALCTEIDAAAERERPDVAYLLVYGDGKKPPRQIKDRAGRIEDCPTLKPWEAERWVREYARNQHGLTLSGDAAAELVGLVGANAGRLVQEVNKLTIALDENAQAISAADVRDATGTSSGRSIYDLCDAIGSKNFAAAREIIGEVLRFSDFNGVRTVIFLSYHLVDLTRLRIQDDGGNSGAMKAPPWKLKKLRPQAAGWTTDDLEEALDLLTQADLELKSGVDDEDAIQAFLMRLQTHLSQQEEKLTRGRRAVLN